MRFALGGCDEVHSAVACDVADLRGGLAVGGHLGAGFPAQTDRRFAHLVRQEAVVEIAEDDQVRILQQIGTPVRSLGREFPGQRVFAQVADAQQLLALADEPPE